MKCPLETRENREILVAYSSRALNGGDTERLEAHLQSCSACREFVREQRAVWEALDGWEAAPVSADFDRRLFARIEGETSWWQRMTGPLGFQLVYRALLPVTAVACLVVVGVLLERPSPPIVRPQPTAQVVEGLQPKQVVDALDEMEVLDQFNHLMKPDSSTPRM
jgi:anti-sigma factor RsiW